MKICSKCKLTKDISLFYKNKARHDGIQSSCIECTKNSRSKNKERNALLNHNNRVKNPNKYLFKYAKRRSKQHNLDFDLELDDIQIPEKCPILNITLGVNKKRASDNSPSIDRIDNTKGYVKGNIMIVSWKANSIKNDTPNTILIEYLEQYLRYLKENQ